RMAVPGGAVLDTAAVTQVGVRADHTRRGLLSALMRAQLDDLAPRGEVLAALHASEARIYGRFGYGVATRAREVRVRRSGRGFRPTAPAEGTVRLLTPDEIRSVPAALHDRIALQRPGMITRGETWFRPPADWAKRDDRSVLVAVHTGSEGEDGFVVATAARGHAARPLSVEDMHADSPRAAAALWRFLLDVDLIAEVTAWGRPLDEPLDLLLADPRGLTVTAVEDELWLRLVDVPAALAARSFGDVDPVLLGVHDPLLEGNAGVYRIADGTAERVEPLGGPVAPQIECDVAALAMAYLGDRRPAELAATGWWTVHDPAALERADAAFATPVVPWCGTMF
ncbi:MAG: GNAT family N-acetyltransferase, partial [Pseudonocardiales bacterium]|nr:GNAT family N-acetyltransferase [Pseudonocardiales bacterium]